MEKDRKFIKSLIEVSHIEFQSYSFYHKKLIFTSGVSKKILGYTTKEFNALSRNFYEGIIHPDDQKLLHEKTEEIKNSLPGQVVEMTLRYRRADGVFIWMYTRKMVTKRNKQNYPCNIITVAEDITSFISLQQELKEKVDQLEAISWKNSHLIKGPIASIIGLVNLIEEEEITSQHNREVFEYVKQVLQRLNIVIGEIITEADKHHYR
jgi:PAS domain S-box-containing protein